MARAVSTLFTCALALVAMLCFGQLASAQSADVCIANGGAALSPSPGAPAVCYPIFWWPWWWWGCSWHSCRPGTTCVPTSTWPYYACVELAFTPSPCQCPFSIKFCASQEPPQWCASETWTDITDCDTPPPTGTPPFCTRRQIAKPNCVPRTCRNTICPKCTRCVEFPPGNIRCVRVCKWPCTWCPWGSFCVDHNIYGAYCVSWPWWQWWKSQAVASGTAASINTIKSAPITCANVRCANGPCNDTPTGPQCGEDCPTDNCIPSVTVEPPIPRAKVGIAEPKCLGCDRTVRPAFVTAAANSCVNMRTPCSTGQVCVEPASDTDVARCVTL